mmetsp:Transcript_29259/g.68569  ORF Transcript_29259/g.68569 Transcript_29259/m.68569 type:complete len:102 (+) Transcript_29259:1240-1545(+)
MLDSRFDDTWVEAHHEAVPMDGPRGGGFLLDTNALHVGRWQGRDARSVVVIELDRQGRCRELVHGRRNPDAAAILGNLKTPCPSSSRLRPLVGAQMPRCVL